VAPHRVRELSARASVVGCHDCALVVRLPANPKRGRVRCPRCGAAIHRRRIDSISRTWALLIAAVVCYVPANALPVMTTVSLGSARSDTILSGVVHLLHSGMWPLAVIVFFASFVVPMLKMVALVGLLISIQRGSQWRPVDRTRIYRITEAVGRWSMVDVYVVTILVALVSLGNLATVAAGPGAVYFGAVVVFTMLAAETFDPRLIWDRLEPSHA
jgi:paraquat-inducible protein A